MTADSHGSLIKKTPPDSGVKVPLDFSKNKDLLDIILLLPDSVFSSWEWKIDARKKWYNEIKANNFYIDNDPNFFTQRYFKPNFAEFSIVDGKWSVSLYQTSDNSFIVITDDIVGDGNDINIYEVKSNKIQRTIDMKTTFGDYVALIKQTSAKRDCAKLNDELNGPIFSFDFSDQAKVEIESSWYLLKDQYAECLKGNALFFNFNSDKKTFDLKNIYWKPKTK